MRIIKLTRGPRLRDMCVFSVLVAAAILGAPLNGVQAQESPAANTPVLELPFTTKAGTVIIPIHIGDSRVLRCMLDTGMVEGVLLFDPQLGADLGLEYVASMTLQGAGSGSMNAGAAMGLAVRVGDLAFDNQMVAVIEESTDFALTGVDGVIGATIFNRYVVQMDFDANVIRLYESATFDPVDSGEILPLTIAGTKPFMSASVSVGGGEPVPVILLVDTGAGSGLTLFATTLETLRPPSVTIFAVVGSGMGGDVHGEMGRISSLQLGSHKLENLVVAFSDEAPGAVNGILGMGVLERFVVTFDYVNERLMFRASGTYGDPFEFNMAGLVLRPRAKGRFSVHDVIDDSPAALAGVRAGDIIVAIDGRPLAEDTDRQVRREFKRVGKTIVLTIERDGDRIDISLQLRRLI